jgi:hypothetical protein
MMMFLALLLVSVQTPAGIIKLSSEDYVAAVVTGESSVFQSAEALKAMAVAARTYAARMHGRHAEEGFDFCSTTHCQRYVAASPRAEKGRETPPERCFSIAERRRLPSTRELAVAVLRMSAPYGRM